MISGTTAGKAISTSAFAVGLATKFKAPATAPLRTAPGYGRLNRSRQVHSTHTRPTVAGVR